MVKVSSIRKTIFSSEFIVLTFVSSRRYVARAATPIALNGVANCKKYGCSKNSFAGVEKCVLLELLIACGGFAVAFSWIHDPSTRDALRLGRKAEDPAKADDSRGNYKHYDQTHLSHLLR
jgi:hypothetical protein